MANECMESWLFNYELLKKYYEEHGNIDVPHSYEVNGVKLGNWLHVQRGSYNGTIKRKISEERIRLLDELGMKWDIRFDVWLKNYNLLKEYYEEHGNVDVPNPCFVGDINLGEWLVRQRLNYNGRKRGKLTDKQIKLLDDIGVTWSFNDKRWFQHYLLLEKYYKEHGNIDMTGNYEVDGVKLGMWLHAQRDAYHGRSRTGYVLTKERINLLEKLGMKWNLREEKWDDYYYLLEDYYKEHGNIDVPKHYVVNGVKLGIWIRTMRQAYKGQSKATINEDQILLLNDLGMKWDVLEERWLEKYNLLLKYYEEYGDINIPRDYKVDSVCLGVWLGTQRQAYKGNSRSKITKEQIKLLNELNMDWNTDDTKTLNNVITDINIEKYNKILLERLKHILEDLVNEGFNEINSCETQKEIEDIVVKRLWR